MIYSIIQHLSVLYGRQKEVRCEISIASLILCIFVSLVNFSLYIMYSLQSELLGNNKFQFPKIAEFEHQFLLPIM